MTASPLAWKVEKDQAHTMDEPASVHDHDHDVAMAKSFVELCIPLGPLE